MYNPEDTILKYKHLFRYGTLFTMYHGTEVYRVLGYNRFGLCIHSVNEPESEVMIINVLHTMEHIEILD